MNEIDISKVIAELTSDIATKVLKSLYEVGSKKYKEAHVVFEFCFKSYLERAYLKYSKIKTLLYRDKPVDLKTHYVETDLRSGDNVISEKEFVKKISNHNRTVVMGTAGSGKSLFLKSLLLQLIENRFGLIPIFIELRHLKQFDTDGTILKFIFKLLHDINNDFVEEQLFYSLKKGKILLLLDGFDEIDHIIRKQYEKELLEISNKYPNTQIIISSRPADVFSSWEEFQVFYVVPFTQEKAIELISKIEYDDTVKSKFISHLEKGLFESHKSFLSNPLLITMMLLTYEQLAEIPDKLHIFYEQAFDTLFHKHDALKSLYKRKSYSGLPIDEFKIVFSAFCILSYADKKHSFNLHEIKNYIKTSSEIESIQLSHEEFLKDLLESICVMQLEGLNYIFSHRSFQEYFSALFLARSQSVDVDKIIDKVTLTKTEDNMLKMLFDMNKELVEKKWIKPKLEKLLDKLEKINYKEKPITYLSKILGNILLHKDFISYTLDQNNPDSYFFVWLVTLYKNKHSILPISNSDKVTMKTIKILKKIRPKIKTDDVNEFSEAIYFRKLIDHDKDFSETENIFTEFCEEFSRFANELNSTLEKKYEKRDSTIAELLMKKILPNKQINPPA